MSVLVQNVGLAASLQALGFWGYADPPALPVNAGGGAAFKAAKKRGGVINLLRLRGDDDDEFTSALCLNYALYFPSAENVKAKWTALTSGAGSYLEDLPNAFAGSPGTGVSTAGAVGYTNFNPNVTAALASTGTGAKILKNTPFSIRLFLVKPAKEQRRAVFTLRWHKYQFQIAAGRAEIMRLKPAWTQTQEDALNTLLEDDDLDATDQAAIDALRALIHDDYQSVSLSNGDDKWYNEPFTLTFTPEPRGKLSIILAEGKSATVDHSAILATRAPGVLWEDSPLTIRSTGGGFFWQTGYPLFLPTGELRLGEFKTGYWEDFIAGFIDDGGLWDTSLAGTSVTIDGPLAPTATAQFKFLFATSNRRVSPFFYHGQIFLAAGARTGDTDEVFDSGDQEINPILDVSPTFEGGADRGFMRRAQYQITLRDVHGATFDGLPGFYYEALENRVASLSIEGQAAITNGLIVAATLNDMAAATPNQPRSEVTRGETTVTLTLCDQWAILDEHKLQEDPIGDGKALGAYIRVLLRSAGIYESEMAGVDDTGAAAGRILPQAALGEAPAVRPEIGVSLGDYLRSLIQKYGLGRVLYITPEGVWTLGFRDTTVKAEFTSTDPDSLFTITSTIDEVRELNDFANVYRAEGATGPDGKPLVGEWILWNSVNHGPGPGSKTHIGRKIRANVTRDEGLRTESDLLYALRTQAIIQGRPGRFLEFSTLYIHGLYPGDRVTVDGTLGDVARISGGSTANNTMRLTVQEIE